MSELQRLRGLLNAAVDFHDLGLVEPRLSDADLVQYALDLLDAVEALATAPVFGAESLRVDEAAIRRLMEVVRR